MTENIEIDKKEIIYDEDDQCYGEIDYLYQMDGEKIRGNRELFSSGELADTFHFVCFKTKSLLIQTISLALEKGLYKLRRALSGDSIMFNFYNGPGCASVIRRGSISLPAVAMKRLSQGYGKACPSCPTYPGGSTDRTRLCFLSRAGHSTVPSLAVRPHRYEQEKHVTY